MVFQSYALWPHMTVRKNIAFGLEERRVSAADIRSRVDAALEMVGLLDLAERRPAQLSGDQQQRVALARTIVIEPKVLLLDEPLSNLDANLRVQMRRDIRELQQKLNLTTIFVTHDQEEANTIADRMAVLDQGIIQQVGAPVDLYDRPANLFVANFVGSPGMNFIQGGALAKFLQTPAGTVLGLRPESLAVDPKGPLTGTVVQDEYLGSHRRLHVKTESGPLVVRRPDGAVRTPGSNVRLGVRKSHVRLFDGASGRALDSG